MTIMEFTLEAIRLLVWPTILLIALFLLRTPLVKLIPLARSLKYKDLEIGFGQELRSATEQAEVAFNKPHDDVKSSLLLKASHFPNDTILDAWSAVDDTAEKLIRTLRPEISLPSTERYKALQNALIEDELLTARQVKLFSELRQLRNKVAHAHGFVVNASDALLYIELCFQMIHVLKRSLQNETVAL